MSLLSWAMRSNEHIDQLCFSSSSNQRVYAFCRHFVTSWHHWAHAWRAHRCLSRVPCYLQTDQRVHRPFVAGVFTSRCPSAQVVSDRCVSSSIRMLTTLTNTFLGRSHPRSLHRLASSFTRPLQMWQMLSVMSIAVEEGIMSLPRSKSSVKDL